MSPYMAVYPVQYYEAAKRSMRQLDGVQQAVYMTCSPSVLGA